MGDRQTTEEKIKTAAREIFMKKGYSATKTRDIAEHAKINLALLNYYFRSKEKLFNQIMMESLTRFFQGMTSVFMETETTLEQKFTKIVDGYIEHIKLQPDTPLFILSEIQRNPEEFLSKLTNQLKIKDTILFQQLAAEIGKEKLEQVKPIHFFMNLMSMTLFPFIGRKMLEKVADIEPQQFDTLMEERKILVPMWVMKMLR